MPKRKPGRPRKKPLDDAPIVILQWRGQAIDPVLLISEIIDARVQAGEPITKAKEDLSASLGFKSSSLYDWLKRRVLFPRDPAKIQVLIDLHKKSALTSDLARIKG